MSIPSSSTSTCGTPYASYTPDLPYVEGSTIGIAGSGIVLGIVRTIAAYPCSEGIGYRDPNVPCGRNPAVRWTYGEFLGPRELLGWIPIQDPAGNSGETRQC